MRLPLIAAGAIAITIVPGSTTSYAKASSSQETAILAGGCFWGVEGVFEHVKGVSSVVSGYAGGTPGRIGGSAEGGSGFAEAVRIRFDPAQVSYEQLLGIYFRVAHDPTQVDRQGPDVGPRYRSAIFPQTAEQKRTAADVLARLRTSRAFASPIATKIESGGFRTAEPEHQDFVRRHPTSRYVVVNDLPKLEKLRHAYPAMWKD